jgi:hypothetical protein
MNGSLACNFLPSQSLGRDGVAPSPQAYFSDIILRSITTEREPLRAPRTSTTQRS